MRSQPPWSDFPFVVLTTRRDDPRPRQQTLRLIANLRNVMLQERPLQTVTLVSTVQAALRARLRQYEAAKYLAEREHAASRLEELVGERTRQLQDANDRLTAAQESLTMALEAAQMRTWHLDLGRASDRGSEAPASGDPSPRCGPLLAEWSEASTKELLPEDRAAFEAAFEPGAATPASSISNAALLRAE